MKYLVLTFLVIFLSNNSKSQLTGQPFFDLPDYYCIDQGPINLYDYVPDYANNAGYFTGLGVTGSIFTPNPSLPVPLFINYIDDSGVQFNDQIILVDNCCHATPPNTSIDLPTSICLGEGLLDLNPFVIPTGGNFYGSGVTGNFFDPTNTLTTYPEPVFTITYELYNTTQGCYDYVHDVIEVDNSCCNNPTSTVVVPSYGGSATGLGLTNFTSQDVTILGDFNIDQNFTIDQSLVRFNKDVKVTVQPGVTLTITNGSDLFSCNQDTWFGIALEPGANIVVNGNSLIQDAEVAILASDDATINLTDCIFNKNVRGVFVAYSFNAPGGYPLFFGGNVGFTCSPSVNSPGAILDNNTAGHSKSHIGIEAVRTNAISVGQINLPHNYFDNLEFGIKAEETSLRIVNTKFSNIRGDENDFSDVNGNITVFYYAIYSTNVKPSYSATIGANPLGDFTQGNNIFIDCVNGIYLENYQKTDIVNNFFEALLPSGINNRNGERAITTADDFTSTNYSSSIIDNKINEYNEGIRKFYVLNNIFTNTSMIISNNEISSTGVRNHLQGIQVRSSIPSNLNGSNNFWSISNNKIKKCRNGIWLSGIRGTEVSIDDNRIIMDGSGGATLKYGIRLENCYRNNVINNKIFGKPGFAGNTLNKGIKLAFSNTSYVSCNQINLMGQSMVFEGISYSTITGNRMQNARDGFVLLNNGTIGQQGDVNNAADNRWMGTFTNSNTNVINTSDANVNSPLFLRNQPPTFWPQVNLPGPPNGYDQSVGGLVPSSPGSVSCPTVPLGLKIRENLSKAHQNYFDFDPSTKWIGKHIVYSEIQVDTLLRQQSTILDSFYVASQNTCFDEVNKIINAATQLDTSLLGTLSTSFIPACNIEQNYKDFYSIMYNYWLNDSISASEKTIIENIAWQCPIIGGTVVYSARNFFDFLNNFTTEFEDICDSDSRSVEFTKSSNINDQINLYPNPSNGEFIIDLKNIETEGKLKIYDIGGKEIFNQNLTYQITNLKLDLESGLYLLELTMDGKTFHKKIIIE